MKLPAPQEAFRNYLDRVIGYFVVSKLITPIDAYVFHSLVSHANNFPISCRFLEENYGVSYQKTSQSLNKLESLMLIKPVGKPVRGATAYDLGPFFYPDLEAWEKALEDGTEVKLKVSEDKVFTRKLRKTR